MKFNKSNTADFVFLLFALPFLSSALPAVLVFKSDEDGRLQAVTNRKIALAEGQLHIPVPRWLKRRDEPHGYVPYRPVTNQDSFYQGHRPSSGLPTSSSARLETRISFGQQQSTRQPWSQPQEWVHRGRSDALKASGTLHYKRFGSSESYPRSQQEVYNDLGGSNMHYSDSLKSKKSYESVYSKMKPVKKIQSKIIDKDSMASFYTNMQSIVKLEFDKVLEWEAWEKKEFPVRSFFRRASLMKTVDSFRGISTAEMFSRRLTGFGQDFGSYLDDLVSVRIPKAMKRTGERPSEESILEKQKEYLRGIVVGLESVRQVLEQEKARLVTGLAPGASKSVKLADAWSQCFRDLDHWSRKLSGML